MRPSDVQGRRTAVGNRECAPLDPHAKLATIREQLEDLLAQGIIRESKSHYYSPLVVEPKPNGPDGESRHRIVVDFRELNRFTKTERHPVPRLEQILDKMQGSKVFSKLDLKAGYHQINLHPRVTEKTAFQYER